MAFNPQEHMMNLKGKDYLQVMWRLVWFREDHPNWCINTKLVCLDKENQTAVFLAEIIDDCENKVSTGYGSESVRDFNDYLEKAETKAVGRALAMLGYGTQFAPELDECDRVVDSPVPRPESKRISFEDGERLKKMIQEAHTNVQDVLNYYHVRDFSEITVDMANDIYKRLQK